MWVFVAIASVELIVVHLLVSLLWSGTIALILSIVTLASVIWLVAMIASMRRLPVVLDNERLLMRVGTLRACAVPRDRIAGLRQTWDAAEIKRRDVLNLALIAYPNVLVDLTEPLKGRRAIRAIAHRLDDPAAFATALERLGAPDDRHH